LLRSNPGPDNGRRRGPELTTQPDHVIFVDTAYFGYAAGWPCCDLGQILIDIGCPFPSMLNLA
jgi:hypothetical protein